MVTVDKDDGCKGLIFRYRSSCYMDTRGVLVVTHKMIPLRRMSCRGCEKCGGVAEVIRDDVSAGRSPDIENFEDGGIYRAGVIVTGRDQETGLVDDWELMFDKVKDV